MSSKIIADNIIGGNATDYVQNDANGIKLVGNANNIIPAVDSTTALKIMKADGVTSVLTIDTSNGYVGIGTTTPAQKLDILGNIRANGLIQSLQPAGNYMFTMDGTNGGGPRLQLGNLSNPSAFFEIGAWGSVNNFDSKTRDLKLFTTNGILYMTNTTGNVGIGTTNPGLAKLQVSGSIFATGVDDIFIALDEQSSPTFGMIKKSGYQGMIAHSNNENFIIGMTDAATVNPSGFSSLTQQLVIDTAGNVGIGTTAPTANLQVAQVTAGTGTVTTTGTTALVGSGTQFTNTFKVGDIITVSGETDRMIATIIDNTHLTVTVAFSTSASGLTYTLVGGTIFSVLGNGNVGIGTTTPTDKLQIIGSSLATTAKGGTATDYVQNDANGIKIVGNANKITPTVDSTTALQIMKADGSTSVLTIDTSNGNAIFNGIVKSLNTFQTTDYQLYLKDSSGTAVRVVRDTAWSDNKDSRFFQVGTPNDYVWFTSQNGNPFSRVGFSSNVFQFTTASNQTQVPIGIFEFADGTNRVLNILSGGNVGIGYSTGTEITNNKLAISGSSLAITAKGGTTTDYVQNDANGIKLVGNANKITPAVDSTTALQIMKADGTTPMFGFDTTLGKLTFTNGGGIKTDLITKINGSGLYAKEDGGTTYHPVKWFTPTGTFSSVDTAVTTTGGQLTSSMVGSKIGVGNDKRIITAYLTSDTCTVESAFSQDYSGVDNGSWGVYGVESLNSNGNRIYYATNGTQGYTFQSNGSFYGLNSIISTKFRDSDDYSAWESGYFKFYISGGILFSNGTSYNNTKDIGIRRKSKGKLEAFDGVTLGTLAEIQGSAIKAGLVLETQLTTATNNTAITSIAVDQTSNFPDTGTILIGGITSVAYTSKTDTSLIFESITIPTYEVGTSVLVTSAGDYVQNDANGIRLVGNANKITSADGTNALTILNNGYVGIGTTTPLKKLQVQGDIIIPTNSGIYTMVSGDTHTDRKIFGSDAVTTPTGQYFSFIQSPDSDANDGVQIRSYNGTQANALVTILNGGNVLIGTTTDTGAKLQVMTTSGVGSTEAFRISRGGGYGVTSFNQFYNSISDYGLDINGQFRINKSSGNISIGTSTVSNYKLNVSGDTNIIGTLTAAVKSFVIDHPTKYNMKLQYGVLEGPEHSVYVRGKLINSNIITLPDYWIGLVDENTITVNLTAIGKKQSLYIKDINITQITIGGRNVNCYYTVFAERKDVEKLMVEF